MSRPEAGARAADDDAEKFPDAFATAADGVPALDQPTAGLAMTASRVRGYPDGRALGTPDTATMLGSPVDLYVLDR